MSAIYLIYVDAVGDTFLPYNYRVSGEIRLYSVAGGRR